MLHVPGFFEPDSEVLRPMNGFANWLFLIMPSVIPFTGP